MRPLCAAFVSVPIELRYLLTDRWYQRGQPVPFGTNTIPDYRPACTGLFLRGRGNTSRLCALSGFCTLRTMQVMRYA